MMLKEVTPVPDTALPVRTFRTHLRLGTGFADDGLQDEVLAFCLRAAMTTIERHCGKAILGREFTLDVQDWNDTRRQALRVAPVSAINEFAITAIEGTSTTVDPRHYRLEPDPHRPALVMIRGGLPRIPTNGTARIAFTAGFGPAWSDVPADLAQGIMVLATQFYESRDGEGDTVRLPSAVIRALAPYRNLRLLTGGRI